MAHRSTKIQLADRLAWFEQACRERGLRMTHQRLEIFRALADYPGHPTAEDVYRRVHRRLPTMSLDTVYRTLTRLQEWGLIRRVQVLDNRARFDTNLSLHHHFVCTQCRRVEDFHWPDFDSMKPPDHARAWGNIEFKHVELRGICRDCARKNTSR